MHKVMIVEDERVARESLKYLIDWEEHGFTVAGEAENGQTAIGMMREQRYSLVLTDIRMPVINGLEMIAAIREFSDVPIVILSGYEDFEYARQGMKMGVQDYLLKPVDEDDLIAVLRRMSTEIAEKHRFRRQHDLGLSALRDQVFRKWVRGQLAHKEYEELPQLMDLPAIAGEYQCIVVEMDFVYSTAVSMSDRDLELKRYAVRNILEELCAGKAWVFEESEERCGVLLYEVDSSAGTDEPGNLAKRIAESVQAYAKETVSIGLGHSVSAAEQVFSSFAAAEEALDFKFLHGNNSILQPMQPPSAASDLDAGIRPKTEAVIEALRGHDGKQAARSLDQLWGFLKEKGTPVGMIRMTVLQLFVQILQHVRQIGADPYRLFGKESEDYERVMKVKTMDELLRFTQDKIVAAVDLLDRSKELQPNKVIAVVLQIVEKNYHRNNLSLRNVAEQVYLNPNYLGKLFKSVTDTSFNDHVLQVRMEKAKEFLLYSDKKVYEIAEEVGFGELDWFYKRFKGYAGVSAGEFRVKGAAGK